MRIEPNSTEPGETMTFNSEKYKAQIVAIEVENLHHDVLTLIAQAIDQDKETIQEIDSENALMRFGRHRYHISITKLAAGLAAVAKTVADSSLSPLFVGLGIIISISTLADSVRSISLDEAAICEALYNRYKADGNKFLSEQQIRESIAKLTGKDNLIDERYEAALSGLQRSRIVDVDIAQDRISLQEYVFFGRRGDDGGE